MRVQLAERLAAFLLEAYNIGFVEFHAYAPAFPVTPSEYPQASPLILYQVQQGAHAINLRHETLRIDGELGQALMLLLDGTRDRDALVDALIQQLGPQKIAENLAFDKDAPADTLKAKLLAELDVKLKHLAQAGVFIR